GGQLGAGWHDAERELAREPSLATCVPAVVEGVAVLLDVRARRVQRRMAGAEAQVEEERLLWVRRHLVAHERDRPVDEVLGEVVARPVWRVDALVVTREVG